MRSACCNCPTVVLSAWMISIALALSMLSSGSTTRGGAVAMVPGRAGDPATSEQGVIGNHKHADKVSGRRVQSSVGSIFTKPFALATILHHGGAGIGQFRQAAVENEAIQALAAKVDLQKEKQFTARYPGEQVCDLKIIHSGGKACEGRCLIMKGEPANPHQPAELEAKFMQLGVPAWGE